MSKYVRETGPGYVGRYGTANGKATICITETDLPWGENESVVAVSVDDGVAVLKETDGEVLGRYSVQEQWGRFIALSGDALRAVGADECDIRVYERDHSLLVVPAEADPMIDDPDQPQNVLSDGSGSRLDQLKQVIQGGGEPLRRDKDWVTVVSENDEGYGVAVRDRVDEFEIVEFEDDVVTDLVLIMDDEVGDLAVVLAEHADRVEGDR